MSKNEKPSFLSKNEKLFITVILIFFNCSSPPKMKQHKILCFMHHTVLTINRKRLIQIKYLGNVILVANKMEQLSTNNYRSVNLHLRSSLLDQSSQQHIPRKIYLHQSTFQFKTELVAGFFLIWGGKPY